LVEGGWIFDSKKKFFAVAEAMAGEPVSSFQFSAPKGGFWLIPGVVLGRELLRVKTHASAVAKAMADETGDGEFGRVGINLRGGLAGTF
jgi:hypothetical protein